MSTKHKNTAGSSKTINEPAAPMTEPTIQQSPAGSSKTKELRSHPCITIKWSLNSASRRRIGLPPTAAVGAAAPGVVGGVAWR
ncbi:hypothetical protein [Kribbella sp. NBC_00889]|uniref:hypothetical protein n=1 Tax=Kribbella sp. NBC_00889 TaxID=2975974 RepID=UPI0038636B97|nr:hypothetical protein OG817_31550 [Kribbella sp. NBC_00889]